MNAAHFDGIQRTLERLPDETGPLIDAEQSPFESGSRAAREVATAGDPDAIEVAYSQGRLAVENAGDHLFGLHRICAEPVAGFAACTLARGVLEASALAQWLFDPEIEVSERVDRSMSFRLKGLQQQETLLQLTDHNDARTYASGRIERVFE